MFIFDRYQFDETSAVAEFHYSFDDGRTFTEQIVFKKGDAAPNIDVLNRALFLTFVLIGVSYYKTFPTQKVTFQAGGLDEWQAHFFNTVYQEGLSQYAFENQLTRDSLAQFQPSQSALEAVIYTGTGILSLQSGGKDSLLVAEGLQDIKRSFTPFYISSSSVHPSVLDELGEVVAAQRLLDRSALRRAVDEGGHNGHVPVTYIVQAIALVQSILLGKNIILSAIGHEGEEPHEWIGDLPVRHQWSKTWSAEQAFAEYVGRYISPDIHIGSPLRKFSELRIAELFVKYCWAKYGHRFSSCNVVNYGQGADNTTLRWCGECPKCANSFLLLAPFVESSELKSLFGGQDLFAKPSLVETYKGLLDVDGVMKPFECVGETDELRVAYQLAIQKSGYQELSFVVPESTFDYRVFYPLQTWADELLR